MTSTLKSVSAALALSALLAAPAMAQTTPPAPATKISQAECQSLWNRLDSAKAGNVAEAAAKSNVADFKAVDTNGDGKLTQAEFQAGCDKGLVRGSATTGTGTGTTGMDTGPKK